jgi:hypothetical protein
MVCAGLIWLFTNKFQLLSQGINLTRSRQATNGMIQDTQLAFVSNSLGIAIFVLIIAYHYVTADNAVAKQDKHE